MTTVIRHGLVATLLTCFVAGTLGAETIGSMRSMYSKLGASKKVVVEAFDDPKVAGVTCYLSRASEDGFAESVGASEPGDAALTCVQTAAIVLPSGVDDPRRQGEEVFTKTTSHAFNTLQVHRFYDPARRVLLYLAVSTETTGRSPRNSVSALAVMPWP